MIMSNVIHYDKNEDIRNKMASLYSDIDHNYKGFKSLDNIQEYISQNNVDYVVFDYNSQFELNEFRRLNENTDGKYVLYSSNKIKSSKLLLSYGFADYIPKYNSVESVYDIINKNMSDIDISEEENISDKQEFQKTVNNINKSVEKVLSQDNIDEGICSIMNCFKQNFDYNIAGFWIYENNKLIPYDMTSNSKDIIGNHPTYTSDDNSLSWDAFVNNKTLIIDDISDHKSLSSGEHINSEIIIPIGDYGVINIGSEKLNNFDYMEADILNTWSSIMQKCLDKIKLENNLSEEKQRLDRTIEFINHDMVNMISIAKGYSKSCSKKYNDEELDKIRDSILRLETMINDIKDIASYDSELNVENVEEFNLEHIVNKCWSNIYTKDARIKNNIDIKIKGDKSKISHLFENMFKNSIEHGGVDNIVITVDEFNGGFYISDNGNGVKMNENKIFELGESNNGGGLGLNICKRICDMHNWDIKYEYDDGSVFKIYT